MSGLQERWQAFSARLGQTVPFERLETVYARPPGWYHTLTHIAACLNELDGTVEKSDAVELALWFHDAIYDPKTKDNEEESAAFVAGLLDHPLVPEAVRLILVTKHTDPPVDAAAKLIVDIDLSILGKPEQEFDLYEQQIRTEYAWVPEADYRAGRSRVLQSFLVRPAIYFTEVFAERYELQARKNLARSLNSLT